MYKGSVYTKYEHETADPGQTMLTYACFSKVCDTVRFRLATRIKILKYPANTQRRYNVAATSRRCSDVLTTFLRRCVFAG